MAASGLKAAVLTGSKTDRFGRTADSYNFRAQPINSKKKHHVPPA